MKVGGLGQFRATSQKQTAVYHRCPKFFESLTLIQPQHKGGALKGPSGKSPKADVRLTPLIGRNRPEADIRLGKINRKYLLAF